MIAYIFVRVRNFSNQFVNSLLLCCMPQRDNIIDTRTESALIMEYMHVLQTAICGELEKIATRWIQGREGQKYVDHIKSVRQKGVRRRRLNVKEIEEYFDFTGEDYAAIWVPISFVLDPGFWNPLRPDRLEYEQLRLATLAMICRIIVVLLTGKVQHRLLSNTIRIRILDSTCGDAEVHPWPSMVSSAGRPVGTAAWEEEGPSYPQHNDSPMFQHLWKRIEPAKRVEEESGAQQRMQDTVVDIPGSKEGECELQVRQGEVGGVGEQSANIEERVRVPESTETGRDGLEVFVSLEKSEGETSTISGSEVQKLINDVEAQLINASKKDAQEESVIQREAVYETDEEFLLGSDDEESENMPMSTMSIGSELDMNGYEGMLSMEVLAELDDYRRDDSELDKRIEELLRPRKNEEDIRW